jgi:putative membrane protein
MRSATIIAWLIGLALLLFLLILNDAGRVLAAATAIGGAMAAVVAFHAVPLLVDVVAWRYLLVARPPLHRLLLIRWVGESVNGLFPVPHLGEFVRAGMLRRAGAAGDAGASVVVDVTLGVVTEIPFAALGLALYALEVGAGPVVRSLLLVLAALIFAGGSLYAVQRAGLISLAALVAHRWPGPLRRLFDIATARALDARIAILYRRRGDLVLSALWRFAGWVVGAGEISIALWGLGRPVTLAEAVILESLSQAARTVAFAIPGGLGVQDGALLLLSGQLGIGPETALALALVKRCRELVLGVPGLAAGYLIQARRWGRGPA